MSDGDDHRRLLIDAATRRVVVAIRFERSGAAGVAVGKVGSVDAHAVRVYFAARGDCYIGAARDGARRGGAGRRGAAPAGPGGEPVRPRVARATFLDFVSRIGVRLNLSRSVSSRSSHSTGCSRATYAAPSGRWPGQALLGDPGAILAAAWAVVVAVCGARSGKSYLSALRLLHLAVTVDLSGAGFFPGEVGAGLIVAPDLRRSPVRRCAT